MEKDLISVIVPLYKVEKYLDECVQSLVSQTYRNIEIILVDDGSPDACPAMCDEWARRDSRVRVIHKTNGGLSDARNAGIDESKGQFVMFVDSDDFIKPQTVEDLYGLITATGADIACGGVYKYHDNQSREIYNQIIRTDKVEFTGIEQLKNMLESRTECSAWAKLFTRTVIGDHRFIKGRYNEDVIFLFPLYATCNKVVYTQKRYYYYRDTPGSVTNKVTDRTMHMLQNAVEMKGMAEAMNLPVEKEMQNYMCRTCLELGYAIQRSETQKQFPVQSEYCRKFVINNIGYILRDKAYSLRDLAHALIVIVRL